MLPTEVYPLYNANVSKERNEQEPILQANVAPTFPKLTICTLGPSKLLPTRKYASPGARGCVIEPKALPSETDFPP